MERDAELDQWREEWQAQRALTADLRHRVENEIRAYRAGLVAAIVVTAGFGVGVPAWALASRRMDVAVLAAGVWVFIAATWAVSWRLDRGLSRPAASSTAAYLEFCIASCRRRHSAIPAGAVLYAAMFTFNLAWVYQTRPRPDGVVAFLASPRLLAAYMVTAALAIVALRARHRLRRELGNFLRLRQQL